MNKFVRPSMFSNSGTKKTASDFSGELHSTISYRALEPRIAFDGAAAATAAVTVEQQAEAPPADGGGDAAGAPVSERSNDQTQSASPDSGADLSASLAAAMGDSPSPQVSSGQTVVFVDRAIENIDQVISAISPDYEIVLIDAASSGLEQIAAHLSGRSDIDSIHIVSHGEAGTLYLGLDALTSANLADYASALATIGSALSDTGDILLYGCEIGNGTGGMDFVRAFAEATNADVAASVDNTGGDEAGGDWVLEATAGAIEGTALSNPLYAGLLLKTNTGVWTANGATAANDWVNTVDGVTTTVTFDAAFSAASGVQTLNTIAAFDNAAQGGASLGAQWNSGAGTVTITFSTAITNPVIHLDRLGGVNGTSNSSLWTLATVGASLTKLSGPAHFEVNSATGTIQRTTGVASAGSESSLTSTTGSSAGSVRINGTFTTITFNVGQASGPVGADGFEMAFAIDAPPVAVADTFATPHDVPVIINVRANDSDIRGDALSVTQVNGTAITAGGAGIAVTGGVVTLNGSGNLVFTPTANSIGSPSFTYTIADANGGRSTATVSGTVTNITPALDLDASGAGTGWTATFTENGTAVSIADIDAAIVDADDSNMESATVTLTNQQTGDRLLVNGSSAASGTLASGITWTRTDTAVTLSGSFTKAQYAAALQLIQFENTTDTPSITPRIINTIANDGHANSNAAVTTINIDRAPDPVNDAYAGNEDTAISGTVLTNDDLGDTPIASVTVAAGPANGTLTSFNTTTGAFVYTPGAHFNGSDTFTYTVTDADGDTKTATVTITVNPVNDLPVAAADSFATVHDQAVTISVLANDSDVETPVLTITQINGTALSIGGAGVAVTGGIVTLNAGGTLTFTPNADYAGSPSFTYTVADSNGATATATVSGTVTNVGPALDLDASGTGTGWTATFNENGPAVAIADLDAAIADGDDTNMTSAAITLTNPQAGDRLLVDGSSAASGTLASGIAWTRTNSVVTLSGSFTKAQYAAALALIRFENTTETPATAPRIINVVVSDGIANSNTSVATININLAPDPVNDAFTGNEDTAITGSVLANDTDIGTTPSIANPLSVDTGPINGTLTSFNAGTGAFSYTPNANFVGTDSFVYRYTDGNGDSKTATVTFTINAVDDTPFIDLNSDASPGDNDRDFVTEFPTGSSIPIAIVDTDADIFEDGEDDVVKVTIIAGGKALDGTDIVTIAGQSFKLDSDASFIGVSYGSSSLDIVFTATTRTITVTFSGDPSRPIPQVELDKLVREITYVSTSITQPPSNRTFEFTVTDAGKNTSPAAVAAVTFLPPPDALDDTFTTPHDAAVIIDVRANDSDPQSDPFSVTHVNGSALLTGGPGVAVTGGVVTLNALGNLVFTPTANYAGAVSFTYTIGDGTGGQDTATVTGTVTNIAPALDLDASGAGTGWSAVYVENGGPVSIADTDSNVVDSDDTNMDSATVTLSNPQTGDRLLVNGSSATTGTIGGITWARTNTTVIFTGTATSADYAAAIRAVQFENTTDTPSTTPRNINTVVNDGSLNSNTAVTTITVDLTPDPVNDAVSGNEDQLGGITGNVLTNDSDLGNTPITAVTVLAAPANGTLTSFNTATGAFVYTPALNFNGTDTFTYTVTDADGDTKTATVTITVAPTNDAPVNIVPGAQTTSEDTPLSITGVSINDVDGAGVALTTTLSIPAGSGALSISSLSGVTVTGAGTANMTISGTAAAINAALATITYTPVADFNTGSPATPINLIVSTSDGIAPAVANTIAITVTPVADITADSVTTNEDAPVAFAPLGNDTFENAGRTITAINGTAITAGGAGVVLTGVGTVTLDALGNLTFTPVANYNGSPSFNYTVTSGGVTETAAVNLTVIAVNDAPTQTVPVAQTTNEDVAKVISGAAVADVDGGSITTTLSIPAGTGTLSVVTGGGAVITGNASGTVTISGTAAQINAAIASITYTPEPDYYGAAPMTMSTTDGAATAASTVAITIAPIADAAEDAVTTNEDTAHTFNVLTGTNGATADTFEGVQTVTGVTQPVNGSVTFAADGTITYTPAANFNGTDTFSYTVTSGGVTETATVTVTVAAVNDAPVNTFPGAQTTSEDTGLVFSTGNGNAITVADADSNVTTTLTVANGALTLGSISGVTVTGNGTGTVTVSGSPAAVTAALAGLTFAPTADWNGTTSLNVSTSDGVAPATVSAVAITVSPAADIAPNNVTTAEDTASTFNVLTNDNFENGGAIVSSVTQPANGIVTIGAGGNVTYTPAANYNGSDTFSYTVTSGGVTETTTVTMTVTPVNDAPVAAPAANQTGTDGAVDSYNAGALFTDVDNASLAFSASGLPAGLSISSATGLISGTIDSHASTGGTSGVYSVTVTATDASGALATTTFTWAIANPAPVAVSDAFTGTEDTAVTGNVGTNDSDPDGDALTVNTTPVAGPTNGTLLLNSNGSFTYTLATNFTGTDTFTYQVTDADGASSTATVTLYVNPINDSPLNTVPGNQSTAEDTPLIFVGPNAITVTDIDSLIIETTLSVAHGTLTLGSLIGVVVVGDGTGSVTLTGSPAAITAALSGLQYVNSPDYYGADTLSIVSTDGIATTTANFALTVNPVADIAADTVTTNEDASISFNVLTGTNGATADTFEGSPAVTGFTQPANGSVTVDGAGNVVYTPNINFNGSDTFSYTVTSGGVTETTTVTVNVTPVNDTPVLTIPAAQNGTEDTPVIFSGANANQIILGDVDAAAALTTTISVPAGTLSAIATPGVTITGNGSGSVTLSGSPAAITAALNGLSYTPVADANGSVMISISTTDGVIAAPVTGSIAITLAPVADIQNDSTATSEDTAKIISVLGNDAFENVGAAVTGVTNGANGVVTINGDGTVTYTPNANFNGSDSFTYTVTSGGVTETATVTVVVSPVNDAPVQSVPAAQVTAEDTGISFSPATGNAITVADLDGDTLTTTVSVTNGTIDLGAFAGVTVSGNNTGIVTITGSAAAINAALDGLTYNPTPDYHGSAVLSVTTSDGAAFASNTIALTVTPVADIAADTISTNEDTPITVNVTSNDTFENSAAAISAVTQPAHGAVSIGAGGLVTYTPAANYNGPDSFTYTVTSGGVSETATVSVTVVSVNDAPVTTVPGGQATNEDAPLVLSSTNGNAITVSDLDGDTLTVTLSGTNGILTLGSALGVTVSGDGTGTVTVSGSAAAINAALNGLTFAPMADYNGTAAISVTTSDAAVTTSSTIGISVNPVVDIVADTVSTNEDVPVTFNVLTNDSFESPGKAVTGISQGASGSASFLADGTLVYTPNANFHGIDTFTYSVTSGGVTETTTVTVTIGDVNDIPATSGLADRSSLDGQTVSLNVAAVFSDTDNATLTYSATGLPPGLTLNPTTGVISGTIDKSASQTGPYTVIVTASDGNPGGSVSTSFTWNVSNPGPTAINDVAATNEDALVNIDVLVNDTDPDNDPLTVTAATAGNGTVTIRPDGTIDYTPNPNFNGTDTIVYQISDGNGGVSTATVTVTIAPVNDVPDAMTPLPNLIDTDSQSISLDFSGAFSDIDGDTLTYSITGLPPGLSFDTATGRITGTIAANASSPSGDEIYPISITGDDGHGGTVTTTFNWRILNLPPASGDDAVTTPEDTPVVATVLSNDFDPDGDPLVITHINGTAISVGNPVTTPHGVVSLGTDAFGNQVLIYTPNANFNGVETIIYTTSDGNTGTDTATLTITVTPVNDAPVAGVLANLTNNDSDAISVNVSSFFSDIDSGQGDTLGFSAIGLPAGLSINPATGVISGAIDPSASQSGPYTVIVTGTDEGGATVSQTFTWTVNNPKPTAVNDAQTIAQGTNLGVDAVSGILGNDTDPDNDPLTVGAINGSAVAVGTSVAGSSGGLFTVQPDGSYTFDQNGAFIDLQGGETRTTLISYTLVLCHKHLNLRMPRI